MLKDHPPAEKPVDFLFDEKDERYYTEIDKYMSGISTRGYGKERT